MVQTADHPSAGETAASNPLAYSPRLVKALPPLEARGRVLKPYAMFADPARAAEVPDPRWLSERAAAVLGETLDAGDHPLGFLILHYGCDGDYLLVSQWYDANMLKHWVRGLTPAADGSTTAAPLAQRDLVACVWELEVMRFERDAWVNTVLARGTLDDAARAAYLATTFSGWV